VSFSQENLLQRLEELQRVAGKAEKYIIALSGGLDSTVLLHALACSREKHSVPLLAVHVDHQLHPDSASWNDSCAALAADLDVDFASERVVVDETTGIGPEAAAREARYAALARIVGNGEWLLSAHHRDDQAETLLLNLMRGSGPTGIAGISAARCFSDGWLVRAMLAFSRAELLDYARAHELSWIDDPSNASDRFDRNYLRQEILPRLEHRWPQAGKRIVRSADLARDAAGLLAELGAMDLAALSGEPGRIDLQGFAQLSEQRQKNLLRFAIHGLGLCMPSAAQLQSILEDLLPAREDAAPLVRWPGVEVRRYRDYLYLLKEHSDQEFGELELVEGAAQGLSEAVVSAGLELRYRSGGEEFQPVGQTHTKKLKKLLQEEGIVPWMRDRLPLLYSGGRLVAVADLWLAADAVSEPGTAVHWKGRPALH
jgi:tRNA(Ile)-lysidine synthase